MESPLREHRDYTGLDQIEKNLVELKKSSLEWKELTASVTKNRRQRNVTTRSPETATPEQLKGYEATIEGDSDEI